MRRRERTGELSASYPRAATMTPVVGHGEAKGAAMVRRYSAFMLRVWRRDDGSERIEIEHIQAGTRAVVTSIAAAVTWLSDHTASTDRSGRARAGPEPATRGGDEPPRVG